MSEKPLVSIITPSYNQAAYLEETMMSVLNQDYPNLEYIVVDGGSTDGSREIIQQYSGKLKHWLSEPDQGQAEAINKGLALATGDIIGWLNSDDVYLAGTISSAVEGCMDNPDWVLIHGDVLAIDSEGRVINRIRYRDLTLEDLMCFNIIGQPAVFFRRTAMERAGYLDPGYHLLLDHQYWLRLAQYGGIGYIRQDWAKARFHSESKNVSLAPGFGKEAFDILEWMEQEPSLANRLKTLIRKARAGAHWLDGRYLSEAGKAKPALKAFSKSLLADPSFVLRDWKRFVYTLFVPLGIGRLHSYTPAMLAGVHGKELDDA
jgi:glycosyltransferase involved in cell wall biosynthesis